MRWFLSTYSSSLPWRWRLWLVQQVLANLQQYCAWLLTRPRHMWQQRLTVTGTTLAILLGAVPTAPPALAAPQAAIVVSTTTVAPADDGQCGIVEAVNNANSDSQQYASAGECAAGSGPDTITLAGNSYSFTAPFEVGSEDEESSALPSVTSVVTIEGNGSTLQRTGGSSFRLIRVADQGNLTLNETTLSGGTVNFLGGGLLASVGSTVTVSDSTLSGNSADYGGGLFAVESTVTVTGSTLSDNSADYGGGLDAYGSTVTVSNSTLSGNSAGDGGGLFAAGGEYVGDCVVTVSDSTVSGNSATDGGGLGIYSGIVTVSNSTLSGNSAAGGGGLHADAYSTVTVSNSTLSGNSAGRRGGGLYTNDNSPVTVSNSTLSGNSANDGGGLHAYNSTVTVSNSTLSGNSASYAGGLHANENSTVTVSNSTLSGNSAYRGGGLYSTASTVTVSTSTLSGNSATTGGGGLYVRNPSMYAIKTSSVTLEQSIVAGNRVTDSDYANEIHVGAPTVTSLGDNVLGDAGETSAQAFDGFIPADTDFVATSDEQNVPLTNILDPTLQGNGGPTETHALVPGSPAIDIAPTGPATDQRGVTRPQNNSFDAGAFELEGTPTALTLGTFGAEARGTHPALASLAALLGLLLSALGWARGRR